MSDNDNDILGVPDDVPMSCLGLSLDYSPEAFGAPLEVLVVAKVIHQGEFTYRMLSTADLNSVEALGMLRWGQILLEDGLTSRHDSNQDEE